MFERKHRSVILLSVFVVLTVNNNENKNNHNNINNNNKFPDLFDLFILK